MVYNTLLISEKIFMIEEIKKILDDKKCEDLVIIDVTDRKTLFDTMIIGTCTSNRHIKSTADFLYDTYKKRNNVRMDGDASSDWIVVEIDNILVHLFKAETRALYKLEELWTTRPMHSTAGEELKY
jgi:ribosome-associated protein